MKIVDQLLPGVYIIDVPRFEDSRGYFLKPFSHASLGEIGIDFSCMESFYSLSKKGVIRGMHYQDLSRPQDKIVYCTFGSILDVVVDIRPESRFFNQPKSISLKSSDSKILYISSGFAHGFLSQSENTFVHYFTSTNYDPKLDMGVAWNSIPFEWPVDNPILSSRDCLHPSIDSL